MKLVRKVIPLFLLLSISVALAQDNTCGPVLDQAISSVQSDCNATARNQACYGNTQVNATPRQGVQSFTFDKRGDIVNVVDLNTLRLSALDPANDTWGVALMQVQANLPDTLPGQNVTFLLFGDVQITNEVPAAAPLTTVEITSNNNINVRSGPSTNAAVLGSLANDETAIANGRNNDSSWLRIQLPDSNSLGWVFANLVTPASDVSALTVVDPSQTEVPFTPMQAFRFSSGLGSTTCTDAPKDGILIQTPEGVGKIELRVNDVDVQLGSTAFFRAQANANMTVSLLEGEGQASADGKTVILPAGSRVEIPMDANMNASAQPDDPVPYDINNLKTLPIQALPRAITIAPAATQDEIKAANSQPGGVPGGGVPGAVPNVPGVDLSGLAGMSPSAICPYIDQALSQAGMTRQQYLALLQQVMAYVPADQKQQMTQFEQLIANCP